MNKPKTNAIAGSGWDIAFWFAMFSPLLGAMAGFLTLLLFYR
jgi:hypothetical protein